MSEKKDKDQKLRLLSTFTYIELTAPSSPFLDFISRTFVLLLIKIQVGTVYAPALGYRMILLFLMAKTFPPPFVEQLNK